MKSRHKGRCQGQRPSPKQRREAPATEAKPPAAAKPPKAWKAPRPQRHISAYPLFAFRGGPFGHHVCAEGALPGAKAKPQTKERSPSDRGKAPSSSKATKGMEGTKATATYKGGRPHVQTRVVMHGGCSGKKLSWKK